MEGDREGRKGTNSDNGQCIERRKHSQELSCYSIVMNEAKSESPRRVYSFLAITEINRSRIQRRQSINEMTKGR